MSGRVPRREGYRRTAADARDAVALAVRAAPGAVAGDVVLVVVAGALPVLTAWLTKVVLDALVAGGTAPVVLPAVALAAVGVATVLTQQTTRYVRSALGRAVTELAQWRLYDALGRLQGLARLEDPRFHDRVQLAQSFGRSAPGDLLGRGLAIGQASVTLLGFLGTLLAIGPVFAVVVALAAVPALAVELTIGRRRADMLTATGHGRRRELFYAQLLTDHRAAKEIRLLGLGGHFGARMRRETAAVHREDRRADRRELVAQVLLGSAGALIAGFGLVWAVRGARTGELSVGDVSVFAAAVAGTQAMVLSVVRELAAGHQALLLFGHYAAVVRAEPDLPVPARPRRAGELRDRIELRDVWFRYRDDGPWVLRGVNLTIRRGETVALVGVNGAGKSTLVKLLCRFYDPVAGSITWDGVDLRELRVDDLRKRIGAVFQDYMTYDLTARENIGVGDLTALGDDERLHRAARQAQAHDLLAALPRGYDTPLTRTYFEDEDRAAADVGVLLSGGQWQRIALARAFLRDRCDLLLLDEPSSGLDAEAEHELHTRLRAHREGRTSVVIAHRLSAVRDADRIAVLDDGEVVEEGAHADLMAVSGGRYGRLFRLQSRGYGAGEAELAGRP
ncbi:ABC transporter ATP-binding protein [Amycolatopsis sp. NPDC051102]|uniref:ABC transporter ATP-binding protein n=1 Tax=Amycolatopsis sp. NPDC051102 TaxID=3155163 RepID=UPI0034445970